jgi:hypothetical protein
MGVPELNIKPMRERLSQFHFLAAEIHNDEFHFRRENDGDYVKIKSKKKGGKPTYRLAKEGEKGKYNRYPSTPHLHVDFIPWGTGFLRGPDKQIGYNRALEQMGFEDFQDYRDRERKIMYMIGEYVFGTDNYKILRNEQKTNDKIQHDDIPDYQERREIERLVKAKSELEQELEDERTKVAGHSQHIEVYEAENEALRVELAAAKAKLSTDAESKAYLSDDDMLEEALSIMKGNTGVSIAFIDNETAIADDMVDNVAVEAATKNNLIVNIIDEAVATDDVVEAIVETVDHEKIKQRKIDDLELELKILDARIELLDERLLNATGEHRKNEEQHIKNQKEKRAELQAQLDNLLNPEPVSESAFVPEPVLKATPEVKPISKATPILNLETIEKSTQATPVPTSNRKWEKAQPVTVEKQQGKFMRIDDDGDGLALHLAKIEREQSQNNYNIDFEK